MADHSSANATPIAFRSSRLLHLYRDVLLVPRAKPVQDQTPSTLARCADPDEIAMCQGDSNPGHRTSEQDRRRAAHAPDAA